MTNEASWVVHKFGGSSVADAACFRRVADIVETRGAHKLAIVLSACRGVTDALYALVAKAEKRDDVASELAALQVRHAEIAEPLLSADAAMRYLDDFASDLRDIEGVLQTVRLTRAAAQNVRDLVAGYGEIWSSKLFTLFLKS